MASSTSATRISSFQPGLALRLAARGLRRDAAFTLLGVAVLALGLAAPATFFSFLVGAIRPLPVPDGERVARIDLAQPSAGGAPVPATLEDVASLQGMSSLAGVGGFAPFSATLVDRDRAATRLAAAALTSGALTILRVAPEAGRVPTAAEASTTLLLGHDVSTEVYGSATAALGRSVEVNGVARTVVGVMPEGFGFPFRQNAWILLDPTAAGPGVELELFARLAPGATHESASAELGQRWLARDALRDPEHAGAIATVLPYTGSRRGAGEEAVAFLGLVLVALCLLVIACANVANLLLVRATERVRALSVQAALGAGRAQIAAQLFFESLLIALLGGAVGLLLASGAVSTVQRTLATEHFGYFWMRMAVDQSVVAFTALLLGATAVFAGLLPIARVLKVDVQRVLKEEAGGATIRADGRWIRAFVTAQLALSCGALVAAALTGDALATSRAFGRGVPAAELLVASLDMAPAGGTATLADRTARSAELLEALAAAPAVREAALALAAPGLVEPRSRVDVGGAPADRPPTTTWNAVTPSYLAAIGGTMRSGRGLTEADDETAERVAVVSESFARTLLPGGSPLGRTVRLPAADSVAHFTVVGVMADIDMGVERARAERVHVPLAQVRFGPSVVLMRGRGGVDELLPALRAAAATVDPAVATWGERTLADAYAYLIRVPRALSLMALTGGAAGLLVAVAGLYGLLAFRVRGRRRDMGVRLALGADGARLARDVLTFALRQLLPAVAVGLTLAWLFSPVLQAMLFGRDPRAPGAYVAVGLGFVLAGLASAALPAARARAVEPARVLRGE